MKNSKINKKRVLVYLVIFIIVIASKIILPNILPSKYYSDSATLLKIMRGDITADKSYSIAASFFNMINVLNLKTLLGWSVVLGIVMIPILLYLANKIIKIEFKQVTFLAASIFLLGLYVLTISKDFLHIIVIIAIFGVLIGKVKEKNKLFITAAILITEGLLFRRYYIIVAFLVFIFYSQTSKKKIKKMPILTCILIFMVSMALLQSISPQSYDSIVGARDSVNINRSEIDTSSLINNLLPNNNIIFYFLNFIINFVRLALPLELIFKGPIYIIYVVYQLFITYILFQNSKKVSSANRLPLSLMLAYFTTSVLFEPDFGSFLRHESVYFLIVLLLINSIRRSENVEICG